MEIIVPKEYPYVLLSIAMLCFTCFIVQFAAVIPARLRTFNAKFMEQFQSEHEKAFPGTKVDKMGFPDVGDGRYSEKLEYKAWVEFSNAMRVSQNFVEWLPLAVVFLGLGGLVVPKVAMYTGFINVAARIVYCVMYLKFGSNKRYLGAVGGSAPLYGVGIAAFVQLVRACM